MKGKGSSIRCLSCRRLCMTWDKHLEHGTSKLDAVLKELGFKRRQHEQAMYVKSKGNSLFIVGVYVDDLLVNKSSLQDVESFKQQMKNKFEMKNLGLLCYYLGIKVA